MGNVDSADDALISISAGLLDADRHHFFHPGTHAYDHAMGAVPSRLIRSAEGLRIRDDLGNVYIDAFAGLYCVNVGYGREEIADAIYAQAKTLGYYHTYLGHTNDAVAQLSQRLIRDWSPRGMAKVFFGMSGSDANETQIKLAWYYNNVLGRRAKKKIISRARAYHGSGIVTGSLTGLATFHANFDLPIPCVKHTLCPDYYGEADAGMSEAQFVSRCVDHLERLIASEGADTVAAFIAEPMMGSGGIVPPPEGYWSAIQDVLRRHDILLIADEVVCGFGRLGSATGSSHYGVSPDLVSIAKGLTSAYVPLSGAIVSERVWEVICRGSREFGVIAHGWTYSGHPVAAAAALANLDILEREKLVENARIAGAHLQARLRSAFDDHPLIGDVRGCGMLAAMVLVEDKETRRPFARPGKVSGRIVEAARKRGLIVRALGHADIVGFAPPLIATIADIDEIVSRASQAVDDVARDIESAAA